MVVPVTAMNAPCTSTHHAYSRRRSIDSGYKFNDNKGISVHVLAYCERTVSTVSNLSRDNFAYSGTHTLFMLFGFMLYVRRVLKLSAIRGNR